VVTDDIQNPQKMEKEMKFQRVIMILLAALLLPGLALAQTTTTRATFEVTKDFSDDNPAEVSVTLNCFTGLPLTQSKDITENGGVVFVVESFESGQLDCSVTEDEVTGYSASYPEGDCEFTGVSDGDPNSCEITNSPTPVEVTVNKVWVIDGQGGDQVDPGYSLNLVCTSEIVGGEQICEDDFGFGCEFYFYNWEKVLTQSGTGDTDPESYTADVIPDWDGGTECYVEENVFDSAVEVDNDCGNLFVEIGEGDECTITNTVFFEGIPTLSQYGMAIMALLMLGVGFVGFRRFV
jgi:hypothetical protein